MRDSDSYKGYGRGTDLPLLDSTVSAWLEPGEDPNDPELWCRIGWRYARARYGDAALAGCDRSRRSEVTD